MATVPVRLIGGPYNGETRLLEEREAKTGLMLPLPRVAPSMTDADLPISDSSFDTVEYRYHRVLAVDDGDGLPPRVALVELQMVKPHQVRHAEKLLTEWREHFGMQSIGPWPDL